MNLPSKPNAKPNDPTKAGKKASRVVTFGDFSRFGVYAVHTRFDAVQWFVADANVEDPTTGLPEIIRQTATFEKAVEGLV